MGISKPDDAISLEMIRNYNIKNYKMSSFYDIKWAWWHLSANTPVLKDRSNVNSATKKCLRFIICNQQNFTAISCQ